jgi:two-component system LytT family response regulator
MYQCIIADDHLVERALLTSYIKKIPSLNLVAECQTGLEVLSILKDQPIDIVFSDVDMPDLTGIELVKTLKNPPVFVFISSFPEYAAEGYNLDIIDFAVKPISFDQICKSCQQIN